MRPQMAQIPSASSTAPNVTRRAHVGYGGAKTDTDFHHTHCDAPNMNMLKPTVFLALGLGAAACSKTMPTDSVGDVSPITTGANGGIWAGNVAVQGVGTGLRVNNSTTKPIGYFVVETELAMRIRWAPCTEATGCKTIAPGETVIPASEIPGVDASNRTVHFYWWHLVADRDGKLQPDSVRSTTVRL